ncbi:MAG TPA: single-stranded DNA-binding protein, partial [Kofleriaceae bacterium]
MAGGVNKVILVGNLGADPDMRYTPSGQGVCELRVATSESWNDKNGQRQERVEWHRIVVWGKRAEVCSKYLSKGRQVYVEGRIQTRTYDDKDGNKRYITEV